MTRIAGHGRDQADRIFAEAVRWQIRLRETDAAADAHDAFLEWIRRDPRHLKAYDHAQALWQAMGGQSDPVARDETAIATLLADARPPRARQIVGAVALALLIGLGVWHGSNAYDSLRADHIAWTGQRERVELKDGTRIDLNSGAAIAVDFTTSERRVRMFRGEAFFEVAHDTARPFVVEMPEGDLRVTGTSFNVDLTPQGGEVSLLEGSVQLTPRGGGPAVALAPGQQAPVRADGVGEPEVFDAESRTAWRQGWIVFYRAPLNEVIAELGRYRRGNILLLNDKAAALPVTGAFSTADPDAAIRIITETLGLSAYRLAGALTVIR